MIATKLKKGDEIRVIAPSRSLAAAEKTKFENSLKFLQNHGFAVSFSKNCFELDETGSSGIAPRLEDLYEAFLDQRVRAVLACDGGFNVNQLLEHIDYSLIRNHPKILCGFSDITALTHAIYAKTGLVTYSGPFFTSFWSDYQVGYTLGYFEKCLLSEDAYTIEPFPESTGYSVIQEGECEGEIVGGNLCTLNLLQGTQFMPCLKDKILFLEDDNIMGDHFVNEFNRNLESLTQVDGFEGVKGIVFGRFHATCKMTDTVIRRIVSTKAKLKNMPVVFNVDFGHELPMITFPIGGVMQLEARGASVSLRVVSH